MDLDKNAVQEAASQVKPVTVLQVFSGDLWAGAERMIASLMAGLKRYPDIHLIALSLNEGQLTAVLRSLGIETHVISESSAAFPVLVQQASRLFQGREIELIHSHRNKENLLAFCIRKKIGARRLVTTLHGLWETTGLQGVARLRGLAQERLDWAILSCSFDKVVAVSEDIRQSLVGRYHWSQAQVEVIHNGIEVPPPGAGRDGLDHPFRIGTVGRLVPVKDYDLFLDVARALVNLGENVQLAILGEGPLRTHLENQVKQLGLGDVVQILGSCSDPTDFHYSLDLYLNTSVHEGIPLSILEAMACGKPIVAPWVGGIPEIVIHEDQGLLIQTREVNDFAEACRRLMREHKTRERMGLKGRERVYRSFSSERMANSYRHLYRRLCGVSVDSERGDVRVCTAP